MREHANRRVTAGNCCVRRVFIQISNLSQDRASRLPIIFGYGRPIPKNHNGPRNIPTTPNAIPATAHAIPVRRPRERWISPIATTPRVSAENPTMVAGNIIQTPGNNENPAKGTVKHPSQKLISPFFDRPD